MSHRLKIPKYITTLSPHSHNRYKPNGYPKCSTFGSAVSTIPMMIKKPDTVIPIGTDGITGPLLTYHLGQKSCSPLKMLLFSKNSSPGMKTKIIECPFCAAKPAQINFWANKGWLFCLHTHTILGEKSARRIN